MGWMLLAMSRATCRMPPCYIPNCSNPMRMNPPPICPARNWLSRGNRACLSMASSPTSPPSTYGNCFSANQLPRIRPSFLVMYSPCGAHRLQHRVSIFCQTVIYHTVAANREAMRRFMGGHSWDNPSPPNLTKPFRFSFTVFHRVISE